MKHLATGGVFSVSPDKLPFIGELTSPALEFRKVEPVIIGMDFGSSPSVTVESEIDGHGNFRVVRLLPVIDDDESK